jgi:hypothetical protein
MKSPAPAPVPRRLAPALACLLALGCLLPVTHGCAPATVETRPPGRPEAASRLEAAREALHGGQFASADGVLSALAAGGPETAEGHQALFLLGVLHLDPRNPAWSPAEAEVVLARYLEFPFGEHRPEAVALYALARRLAAPFPYPPVARGDGGEAAPAGEASESERLRGEIAQRDRELARLRDELERIRRRLAPSG